MRHEFTHNGETWVYDTDGVTLSIDAYDRARTLFLFVQQQATDPPRTLRELILSGAPDAFKQAMGALLLKKRDDGTLEPYVEATHQGEGFVRSLPYKEWDNLEACRRDFFVRARVVNIASLLRWSDSRSAALARSRSPATPTTSDDDRSPATENVANDSTPPASSSAA